jgi:hypothetical protein
MDASNEFTSVNGFEQIKVGPFMKALELVIYAIACSQHDDTTITGIAHPSGNLKAALKRQIDVKHQDVTVFLMQQDIELPAISSATHCKTSVIQLVEQIFEQVGVIFNDDDTG